MHRFILCLAFALAFAFELAGALPAHAADSNFTVKNVPVDATAAASVEAQTIAINGGDPRRGRSSIAALPGRKTGPASPSSTMPPSAG